MTQTIKPLAVEQQNATNMKKRKITIQPWIVTSFVIQISGGSTNADAKGQSRQAGIPSALRAPVCAACATAHDSLAVEY